MVNEMKIKTSYTVMIAVCALICIIIAVVNITENIQGKVLVVEDNFSRNDMVYTYIPDELSGSDTKETININTAVAEEIAAFLPGIGEIKAESIVAYREAIGGFKSVEELLEVDGIGESTFEAIRGYCRISDD